MQPFGTLLIANNFGIVGGRDTEDDESYRYRISLKLKSQSGINEAALRFAILQVPGIQDIVFAPFAAGFYAYVYGISPVVPISLIQAVNDQISQYAAYPINLASSAITPDLVGISLATTLSFKAGTTQAEKDVVSLSAASAAQTYIDNLGVGQPLIINNISNQIRQSDARISDVGNPDRPILQIFIWRARADGSRFSRY
jgi:hypothetical protein